jgi:hypothetical protein
MLVTCPMHRSGTVSSIGQPSLERAFVGTPPMVPKDERRLNAIADVQLKGDTTKSGIESKSKGRLSSDAFGKKFAISSSRQGVDPDDQLPATVRR